MFALVNDVEAYPKLFDWCDGASVSSDVAGVQLARLSVRFSGVAASFTTRNLSDAPRWIRLELAEGPFRSLDGEWRFVPLAEDASRIELDLEFGFAGSLIGSALAIGFRGFADRLVEEFVRAARERA